MPPAVDVDPSPELPIALDVAEVLLRAAELRDDVPTD
jgi:hypothetical protein